MCCALLLNNVHKKELFVPSVVKKKRKKNKKNNVANLGSPRVCFSLVHGQWMPWGGRFPIFNEFI